MSQQTTARKMKKADRLARERATTWIVGWERGTKSGESIVKADSEEDALAKVKRSTWAKPSLPTSQWQAIYEEVGLQ